MTNAIDGLQAISVHITDVKKAHKFYAEVLGLKETTYSEENNYAVYAIPGTPVVLSMHVMAEKEQGRPPGTVSGVTFTSNNLEAAIADIKSKGGNVTQDIMTLPSGKVMAVIADPDGNEFIIAKPA